MADLDLFRGLSVNSELYMNDEDKAMLQSNRELLDISKANSITIYGADIQKKMADLSEMMIKSIGETNVDEIGEVIDKTVEYLEKTDDNEEDKDLADSINGQIKAVCTSAEIYSCIGGQKIYNYVVAFS